MSGKMSGKAVLVTGSAGGLGRAIALAFARQGAEIILADLKEDGLVESKAMIEGEGGRATVYRVDLGVETEIAALAGAVLSAHSSLDVLVNNAGLHHGDIATGFAELSQKKWLGFLAVNTVAPLLLAQALRPALAKAKGLIINQSSMASFAPGTAYGVTKAALNAVTYGMAMQFAKDEIRAVAIAPGLMDTEANRSHLAAETQARIKGMQLMKRQGTAEDIANMAVFLASPEGSFVNNQVILVDGGNNLRGFR